MKLRQGFVSNSSSSSYVVILPDDFDITFLENKLEEAKKLKLVGKISKAISELKRKDETNSYVYAGDESLSLSDILSDYIVMEIPGGPDQESMIHLISNDKIDKIRMTKVIPYVVRKDDKMKFYRNKEGTYNLKPMKDCNGKECVMHKWTLENLLSTGAFEIPKDK